MAPAGRRAEAPWQGPGSQSSNLCCSHTCSVYRDSEVLFPREANPPVSVDTVTSTLQVLLASTVTKSRPRLLHNQTHSVINAKRWFLNSAVRHEIKLKQKVGAVGVAIPLEDFILVEEKKILEWEGVWKYFIIVFY